MRIPTSTLRVAFASAPGVTPVWTDCSSDIREWSRSRGRERDQDHNRAGKLTVVLNNRDRQYDPTHTSSPNYPNVLPMRRVQLSVGYLGMVLRANPLAYWRLGESSGTTAVDETENNRDGTYVNTPTLGVTGRIPGNTAVTFTAASSEYVAGPDLSAFEADCTYIVWFKTTSTGATKYLFSEGQSTVAVQHASLRISSGNKVVAAAINDANAAPFTVTGTTTVTDGNWHMAALVKSGTTLTLYVDGVTEGTPATLSGTWTLNTSAIGVLRRSTVVSFMDGTEDEVSVYPTALTAAEIAAIYTEGTSGFGDSYRFTGYADSWEQRYQPPNDAVCVLSCTDAFKVFARTELPTPYEQEVREDGPRDWWALTDSESSSTAEPNEGAVQGTYVEIAERGGTPLYGGSGPGSVRTRFDGQYVHFDPVVAPTGDDPYTVSLWFRSEHKAEDNTTASLGLQLISASEASTDAATEFDWRIALNNTATEGVWELRFDAQDARQLRVPLSFGFGPVFSIPFIPITITHNSTALDNFGWHNVTVTRVSATEWRLYLDGAHVGTDTVAPGLDMSHHTRPIVLNPYLFMDASEGDGTQWPAEYAHLELYDTNLSAATILAHYNAATRPWADDPTGTRIGRLLDYIDWPAGDRSVDTGNSTLLPAILERSLLDHLQEVEATEAGRLFMGRDGKVVFHQRHKYLTETTYRTSQTTFGDSTGEVPYSDLVLDYGDEDIANVVRISAPNQPTQVAEDATSIAEYLPHTLDRQVLEASALRMRDAAYWHLGRKKAPRLVATSITFNPRRDPTVMFPIVMQRDLGHRVTVKRRPQSVGTPIDQETLIEGETEAMSWKDQSWTVTYTLSPAETKPYWRLGNATDGKLGSTTRLAW